MKILQYKYQNRYVFLESFFNDLGISIILKQKDIKFDRERFAKGEQKEGRIDGFIYQENNFALIIENKINHANPTDLQIRTYIEGILGDFSTIKEDKIWVIYLTDDGNDQPQSSDVQYMRDKGICSREDSNDKDAEIRGDRYFAINYKDHILPWLKYKVQPYVIQREQILNTGLLQYIDFLEGRYGIRQQDLKLMEEYKSFKDESQKIQDIINDGNFARRNTELEKIITEINSRQENLRKLDDEKSKNKYFAANILKNLIEEIYEAPMLELFNLTRNYFKSNGLMECEFNRNVNYKFFFFHDASWPERIHFEWLAKKDYYVLYFHIELSANVCNILEKKELYISLSELLKNKGFKPDTSRPKTLSFIRENSKFKLVNPIISNENLKNLEESYKQVVTKDIINKITELVQDCINIV